MAEFAPYLRREFITHTRRVQSLFKRICRNEESYCDEKCEVLFTWATVRAEFEKHRNVKDLRKAKMLMEEGERKLFLNQHPQPKKFFWSPEGIGYHRDNVYPDSHLDLYHPLEKAQYPYYFERREQLKKEYLALYEKTYGIKAEKQLEEYSNKKHYEPAEENA